MPIMIKIIKENAQNTAYCDGKTNAGVDDTIRCTAA